MKHIIKKLVPEFSLNWYHRGLALLAAMVYGWPSGKMVVIGVTGTNGKSTVVNLIGQILKEAGQKVAWTATTNFYLDGRQWLNDQKMTMLGRFKTQKFLREAAQANCRYAIIETSSEGIKQYRHLGINYDLVVFTNLTPEHIEAHGSFENYKKTKGQLLQHLTKRRKKMINGQLLDKTIIVNADDKHAGYFLSFPADKKVTFSIDNPSDVKAADINLRSSGTVFNIAGNETINFESSIFTNLLGQVNIYNCLAAIAVCHVLGIAEPTIKQALFAYQGLPGRYEFIEAGQNFKIMVDYAPEPESMKKLYQTLKLFKFNKIIHVLGSCGGGRDKARRPVLGKLAAANADVVIITNEDPYDEDPQQIIDQVAGGAVAAGKALNHNLFKILDRREAIQKALALAQKDDLVLITGKGCEQFICLKRGKKNPWDDREVVRELLKKT